MLNFIQNGRSRAVPVLAVAAVILVLDQWTKN
jgi:hypothetical protein